MSQKIVIIIGAGPAGLTAAYEFVHKTDITPVIFELDDIVGGISRTVNYKGNRIDIGGHRFFSKSDRVMEWWMNILTPEDTVGDTVISYQNKHRALPKKEVLSEDKDKVMLVRPRLSRIYYLRHFFSYPVNLSLNTVLNLGIVRMFRILFSYIRAHFFPIKPEVSLEDFFINRFGRELYRTFFKDYTEKVWGLPCTEIKADWGSQRVKGLSIRKAITHAIKDLLPKKKNDISQKGTETSLIERFLYPKYGPGQMWETVADQLRQKGIKIHMNYQVVGLHLEGNSITSVTVEHTKTGERQEHKADYVISTMPIKELVEAMDGPVPSSVRALASQLQYRDFMTCGVLLTQMHGGPQKKTFKQTTLLPDTWIYIQEPDVKVGRIQIFNNWSPYLVKDPTTVWIGMEYFVNEGDATWNMTDDAFKSVAIGELAKLGFAKPNEVLDSTVIRMKKTYPSYTGVYDRFDEIRSFTDSIENLFLVGRNGMHRYNNQDHSMLTAMTSVENIMKGVKTKDNIWAVNTEQEYHETQEK